jgi:hypothetical protein
MSETLGWNRADAIVFVHTPIAEMRSGCGFFLQESLRLSKGGRKGEDERAIDDRPYGDTFSHRRRLRMVGASHILTNAHSYYTQAPPPLRGAPSRREPLDEVREV